jgi:restriction endonuclease S subunit
MSKNGIEEKNIILDILGKIPMDWELKTVEELGTVEYGISESVANNIDESIGIPIITGGNITLEGQIDFSEKRYIKPKKNEKFFLKKGDLLFNWRSGSSKHVGKTAIFKYDFECTYASFILKFRLFEGNYNKYYYYLLNYLRAVDYYLKRASVQVNFKLNATLFREILLLKPSYIEQQKIASILSTIDDIIENTTNLINSYSLLKKGLMQTLLIKGIGHTRFKQTEIGEIPEDWEIKKLGNLIEIVKGKKPSRIYSENLNNCKPYILVESCIDNEYSKFTDDGSCIICKKNNVLLLWDGSRAGLVFSNVEGYVGSTIALLKIKNAKLFEKYLYYFLIQNIRYIQLNRAGTGIPHVQKDIINNISIRLPSIREQNKIASILSTVDEKIELFRFKNIKLKELKKGLMQQLLTGKVRVKV